MTVWPADTPAALDAAIIARYRAMTPRERVARMLAMSGTVRALAIGGVRHLMPDAPARVVYLHAASRWLTRERVEAAYGVDAVR
jgi:hypothetical protein